MELREYKAALSAMLFAAGEPVGAGRLAAVLDIEQALVEKLLLTLDEELEPFGLTVLRLENKYQMATLPKWGAQVEALLDTRRNQPLSAAAMETLAVIAYNQPVSRGFVEQVRGVDSSSALQTLQSRGLVEEAGRLDLPGRPISYRTTDVFLRSFGLSGLANLPPVELDEEEDPAGENGPEAIFPPGQTTGEEG